MRQSGRRRAAWIVPLDCFIGCCRSVNGRNAIDKEGMIRVCCWSTVHHNVVVVDKIVGLILHRSPPVARHESRSRSIQLLHQVASGKRCYQTTCVVSSSMLKRSEAVHVKEEQEMTKVILDIVVPRMSTARKPYTANMRGGFMTADCHTRLEWKQRNQLCAASPGKRW